MSGQPVYDYNPPEPAPVEPRPDPQLPKAQSASVSMQQHPMNLPVVGPPIQPTYRPLLPMPAQILPMQPEMQSKPPGKSTKELVIMAVVLGITGLGALSTTLDAASKIKRFLSGENDDEAAVRKFKKWAELMKQEESSSHPNAVASRQKRPYHEESDARGGTQTIASARPPYAKTKAAYSNKVGRPKKDAVKSAKLAADAPRDGVPLPAPVVPDVANRPL